MNILQQFGMESKSTAIEVFIDGSCFDNGKKTARGGYAAVFPNHQDLTFSEPLSDGVTPTNNRAEYMALIRAHEVAPKGSMTVYTDSQLLFNSFTKWIPTWKKNGWKKADGNDVLNLDLVKRIDQIRNERSITMKHVRAHTGKNDYYSLYNSQADELARNAAQKYRKK
jgi:ribonuclease HI